ncbi:alpha-2-HS-glycoprotein-like [Heterodontus francisci]|uniref:alpha-2-HS-glycoprotein-like n=1 Tax=Heterodontus francisci TaxID=7792 RepID=UPI00355B1E1F
MKLFFALGVCLQLCTSWVMSSDSYVAVACNGQEVLAVAELAVDHINKDRKHGYKFSLDRIENAQEMKASGTDVHYLDIEVRETKCHVLSRKPLNDCEIRSFKETKVEGDCKVIIETKSGAPGHVKDYKCEISSDSAEDVSEKCPDCPHLIAKNSTEAQHAANAALNKYNQISNHTVTFALQEITRGSTKGPGTPVLVEFVIRETPCVKGSLVCPLIALLSPDLAFCVASVTPGNSGEETVVVDCEIYSTKVAEGAETASAPEGEGGTVAAPGEEGGTVAAPEANTNGQEAEVHITSTALPDFSSFTPTFGKSDSIPPKRKRSTDESSESSEELLASAGKQTIKFPDLPADATTCPTKHKYPEDQ